MRRSSPARLVVVDDEADMRGLLADFLLREGYSVCAASGGRELDAALQDGPADLILLDVAMPGEDGLSIARRIRSAGATPIIMLSALGDTVDRVVGLEVGADDYIAKPFDIRELRARVRAALRRTEPKAMPVPEPARLPAPAPGLAPFGEVMFNPVDHTLVCRSGEIVSLTPLETDMIGAFLRNPNRVLSRRRLAGSDAGGTPCGSDRAVDIRVTRIRKKIEANPRQPRTIRTVRGAGYIYVPRQTSG